MAYSTIIKPNTQMNPVLYTGNGSTQSITGVNFQPDWVWIKKRDGTVNHYLLDSIRGATKVLYSNATNAEETNTNSLTAFNSDGFSLGNDTDVNVNSGTFVSWNWKAGGTASSNTDGTITSSVSANTTTGFSIVSWTGTGATATVGHGLGTTPKLFIVRERSEARNWPVVTTAIDGSWDSLYLNLTDTAGNNPQSADSSVFNFTSSNEYNASGQTYIAYAFADVKGYSKIGSYQGNTSADGTFLYLGFKPAFLLVKGTTTAESWIMFDNQRGNQGVRANPQDLRLLANANNTEADIDIDFLSNGVKFRTTENAVDHANTYMYMAFAENPLVANTTGGIPTTAR